MILDKNDDKVRTFWETHRIWKNLPHGFDKSADLPSKNQNHEERYFSNYVCFSESPNFTEGRKIFSLFFGRIENTTVDFRNNLTFSMIKNYL